LQLVIECSKLSMNITKKKTKKQKKKTMWLYTNKDVIDYRLHYPWMWKRMYFTLFKH